MSQGKRICEDTIRSILSLYDNGVTFESIAQRIGVSVFTVHKYLHQQKIPIKQRRRLPDWSKLDAANVVNRYELGESSLRIAAPMQVSKGTINRYLRSKGIGIRDRRLCQRRYSINHDFFESVENNVQAYWLGYFSADGCIGYPNSISFPQSMKNVDQVVSFGKSLDSNYPVRLETQYKCPMATICFRSQKMADDLHVFGIVPNKETTVVWPQLNDMLLRPFLSGLISGDGCFSVTKRFRQLSFGLISSPSLIKHCQDFIEHALNIRMSIQIPKRSPHMRILRCSGNRKLFPFVQWLYEEPALYIPYKRDIVLNHYRSLPKYRDQLRFG